MTPGRRAAGVRAPAWARTGLLAAALAAPVLLGGCAALGLGKKAPAAEAGAPPGPPVVALRVDAPAPLAALLERHLDLGRLASLTRGEDVTDTELSRLIDVAPAQARDLLKTEGYFNPTIRFERQPAARAGAPEAVVVHVEPGPRTRVSRVTLEAEGALEQAAEAGDARAREALAEWRSAFALQAGDAFRNPAWSDAKSAALGRLRAAGYAAAQWSGTAAEVDTAADTVRLFLVADSGPLYRVGRIVVEGLARQDESTVRALAGFQPGAPATEALLLDYQERLIKAGLFENVTVMLDPRIEDAAAATVQVHLQEQPAQVYTAGLGWSANNGLRTSLEHVHRRVFGRAVTASNKFEIGRVRQYWSGEVSTHPGERFTRWLVGGAVERLVSTDNDTVLSQRLRFGRARDSKTFEQLVFVEAERAQRTTAETEQYVVALSVNDHLAWRRLDSVLLPTDGYTLALQGGMGMAHDQDGDNGPFVRTYGRFTAYKPFGRQWYGMARIELGKTFQPARVNLPDSQLFRAGGDESVRGYGYRSLGPLTNGVIGSGTVLATASIEVARPILESMPSLWGAAFIDAGRAANSFGGLKPALGYGVGVRWRSPVGPLKLDLAWGQEVRRLRVHFSVGIAL